MTLVPLKIYLERNHAKMELALVKGKKDYDRRQAIADRDAERQQRIEEKDYRRGE
jgi:SsrA-binding protein